MKKLFLILMATAALSLSEANAQTSFYPKTGTVVDTGSDTLDLAIPGYQALVGIQFVATKNSGTAAGIARLYGTIDGTNYVATGDTLTLANVATNSVIWTKTAPVYTKYRIIVTGSGTMNATISAKAIARKP